MPVFRVSKNRDFTVIANSVFKDRRLSAKAKGILVEMLSLTENWDYTLKGLTTLFSDGIDSIRQGIKELEENGYIVRERKRDARGRLGVFTRHRRRLWKTLWKTHRLNSPLL